MPGAPTERPGKTVPSSRTSCASHVLHTTQLFLHNTHMAVATVDPRRLRLLRARRRSTACSRTRSSSSSRSAPTRSPASGASALDPRLNGNAAGVRHERRGARGRRGARLLLPRPRAGGRARRRRRRGRRRPLRRAPARRRRRSTPSGTASSIRGRTSLAEWSYAIPELFPPTGPLIANPGCYATAALLALAPLVGRRSSPSGVVVDAKSGVSGAGRALKASLARRRRARERLAVPGRLAPARARDRAGARLPRLLRPAPAAGAARPARDLLRAVRRADLRELLEAAYATSPAVTRAAGGRRARALARAGHRRRRARRLRRPRDRHARSSSARSTTSARAPPARRCRTRTSRSAWPRRPGCGSRGCSSERHRRQGLRRRPASHAGIRRKGARPRGRPLDRARASARRCSRVNQRAGRARHRLEGSISRSPSRRRSWSTRASRTPPPASAASSTRSRPPPRPARLLDLDAEEVLVLSTGVIGALLPLDKVLAGPARRPSPRSRRTGGADAAEAILTTDTRHEGGGGLARRASPSAGWRRAPG